MFCPKCKNEYKEGFETCVDCDMQLANKLPIEVKKIEKLEPIEYEYLLATNKAGDIALIKSILKSEKIDYYVSGEIFSLMEAVPAQIFVDRDKLEDAKELLIDFV